MKATKLATTLLAGALISATATAPIAIAAEEVSAKQNKTMEQHNEHVQSEIKDAWLHGKLETALLFNEYLNSFSIDTDVKNGVAYLSGAVESDIDRDLAGEIAESIKGISKVKNNLVVDQAKAAAGRDAATGSDAKGFKQAVADATLTARIKSELLVNSNTGGLSINVDTDKGNVTLSGEVDSAQEKELAERIADNTNGAGSVNNRLTIKSES